ncbi:SusC/RagA family TonB-linked outer membrane protein [Chitinophaga sp. sic0106]|uniref:SusC/RagA family TonB-linked outer membrane protein n=1 Tax=Chitinophaga sp. sic0106 TaxID=2854785 RepID=UPI001C484755|nr:SusC/RagA family TonB-linked outer membrane protein [Chitinophaga sp. sic0106]MBV7532989.1 SusC/RagA family TonB-linked outer membrane protein [Chitinophaga sp. sic0106]
MRKRLLIFFLLSMVQLAAFAQGKKVTGKVTATDGSPIPGVSVVIQGTSTGTQTTPDGRFSITVPVGKTLNFRSIGFTAKSVVVDQTDEINVKLAAETGDLNEVVVVAYGTAKKEALTGAVTAIKAKDIEKRPVTNAIGVLEGAAGIQVNNTVGTPGSSPSVIIRGFTSVNGNNQPLYVVDGVIFNGNVNDINPSDVESVSVQKDAASSALYGNRGAAGVIMITTKKAKSGSSNINFTMNQGVYNRGIKEYKTMNTTEFMETMWKGYRNSLMTSKPTQYPDLATAGAKATSSLISDYLIMNIYDKSADQLFDADGKLRSDAHVLPGYVNDLDWYSPVERTGHRQEYNLNGSSNNGKTNLYYSAGYLDEKGYVTRTGFKRYSGRLNADMQATKWMKYGVNLAATHQESSNINGTTDDASSYANPFMFARNIAPIYPVHKHDPATGEYILDANGSTVFDGGDGGSRGQYPGRHTVWENLLNKDVTNINTLNGRAFVNIKFLKDFTASFTGDMNIRTTDRSTYENAIIGDGMGNKGRANSISYRYNVTTLQQLLTYNKSIGLHSIDVLAGHESYSWNRNYQSGGKMNQIFAGAPELINFTQLNGLTGYVYNDKSESYLSRARYNYADKYFLEGSFRTDGSSRFRSEQRWGQFFSAGAGWILSKENFFENLTKYVDHAKVRASYGQVGNNNSADYYAYWSLYNIDQNGNSGALYLSQLPATDLIWETSASYNFALETRILNRANLSVEYFDKRAQNLLFNVFNPLSAGGTTTDAAESTIMKNLGSLSNKGWEINVDVDVLRTKDFKWNVGANATFMKNKLLSIPEQNKDGIITGNYKILPGHGIYDFYTYLYAGVDRLTGNALYVLDDKVDPKTDDDAIKKTLVNINGQTYTTSTTYGKRDYVGTPVPKVYGSFNTSFTYKAFTLSGIFTYSLGNKVYDDSYFSLMSMSGSVSQMHTDLLKAWNGAPEGMTETSVDRLDPNGIPVVDFTRNATNSAMSSRFIKDGSYFVIKNIALSYQMPVSLLSKIDVKSCRINVAVENLATFTKLQGMNPQQSFNGRSLNAFVTPRVLSFGLSVGL